MIEALIAYIEDQGFEVHVFPGVLCIRKIVNDGLWGIDWALSSLELQYFKGSIDFWKGEADRRLAWLRKAIEEGRASHEILVRP